MAKEIVIFGNADIARLAYHYFRTDTDRTVAAFCVDDEWCKSSQAANRAIRRVPTPFRGRENCW